MRARSSLCFYRYIHVNNVVIYKNQRIPAGLSMNTLLFFTIACNNGRALATLTIMPSCFSGFAVNLFEIACDERFFCENSERAVEQNIGSENHIDEAYRRLR